MAKVVNCKFYKSTGNVYGGCKHKDATSACLYQEIDDCHMSERRSRDSQKMKMVAVRG